MLLKHLLNEDLLTRGNAINQRYEPRGQARAGIPPQGARNELEEIQVDEQLVVGFLGRVNLSESL
jgi:hypothetical protein